MRKSLVKVCVILLLGFILGGAVVAQNAGVPISAGLFGLEGSNEHKAVASNEQVVDLTKNAMGVADIVEIAGPAVVNIEAEVKVSAALDNPFLNDPFFRQFFGQGIEIEPRSQYKTGIGTGFIISEDGYIVTNQHVVNNAEKITVKLEGKTEGVPAQIVGQDYELDLAVLKIKGNGYQTLPLGDSDKMRVGESVIAIGEPYGLDHTVTTGVVSAKGRPITIEDRNYKNLIQTDAAINPGNSGGPLLNMAGEVIAINTAVNAQAQGIGFAIPINTAREVLDDLKSGNNIVRPYLGIKMADVNKDVIDQLKLSPGLEGAVIIEVIQNSPAANYGLLKRDVIVSIGGKVIKSASDVQDAVKSKEPGDRVFVEVVRQGSHISLPVVLQAKP